MAIATMVFRQAVPKDWEAVRGLLGSCSLPIDGAQQHFADFLLAFEDGALAACGGLECYGDVALLRSIAVAPSRRGKGLGRAVCGIPWRIQRSCTPLESLRFRGLLGKRQDQAEAPGTGVTRWLQ